MKTNEQPFGDRTDLIADLRRAAKEIAIAGHSGWGNTCADAASLLEATQESLREHMALVKELREKQSDDKAGGEVEWRDHVEQRLLTWRQRFVNRSGDQLALDDFMDKQSIDDLLDYVLDEYTRPQPQAIPAGYALVPVEPDETWAYRVIRHYQPNIDVGCKAWMNCLEVMLCWHAAMLAASPNVK